MRALTLIALLFPLPAFATCDDAQTQVEMTECATAAYQAADGDLNATWKLSMGTMKQWDADNPGAKAAEALRNAQRAWIAFRDAECGLEVSFYAGGTIAPMVEADCLTRLTRARTEELRAMAEGE